MYRIVLTHGRQQEGLGRSGNSDGANLTEAVKDALDFLFVEKRRRGDGLPDGYKVFDQRGQQVQAEWIGARNA